MRTCFGGAGDEVLRTDLRNLTPPRTTPPGEEERSLLLGAVSFVDELLHLLGTEPDVHPVAAGWIGVQSPGCPIL